jgi:hypothetical protein
MVSPHTAVVVVVVMVVVLMAAPGVLLGVVRPRIGLLAGRENRHAVRCPPNRGIAGPPWLTERA